MSVIVLGGGSPGGRGRRSMGRVRPPRAPRSTSRRRLPGVRHTAEHIVLANGADPFVPPVPGLCELDGVWSNREVTSMKAVPRRLLILGGGPVGVEMAQAVRRLGGGAVIVDTSEHVLAREPAPLGEALGEVLRGEGVELVLSATVTAALGLETVGVVANPHGVPVDAHLRAAEGLWAIGDVNGR